MGFQIAIDGPAGAGKSTIAKKLAEKTGFLYVDTGAMYRAIACYFLRHGIPADDEAALEAACGGLTVDLACGEGGQRVFLNGEDVSGAIRREEVGKMASATSGYAFVRQKLLSLQREIAGKNDVIMDGRDIGTCVLPEAQLKVYLTAGVHTRALRRYRELAEKGEACELAAIEKDIAERDSRDMNREIAPLRAAKDAKILDSSDLTPEEVTERIYEMALEAGLGSGSSEGEPTQRMADHMSRNAGSGSGSSEKELTRQMTDRMSRNAEPGSGRAEGEPTRQMADHMSRKVESGSGHSEKELTRQMADRMSRNAEPGSGHSERGRGL